jgi:hypothetical protein
VWRIFSKTKEERRKLDACWLKESLLTLKKKKVFPSYEIRFKRFPTSTDLSLVNPFHHSHYCSSTYQKFLNCDILSGTLKFVKIYEYYTSFETL